MEAPHMPEQSQQERIIVADDHPVFRDGLCRIAQRVFPMACILEAGDMDEVLSLAHAGTAPSLFMLDLLFPGQSPQAISALRQTFARSSIVIVSMVDNRELIDEVMAAGADVFEHSTRRYGKPAFGLDTTQINGETVDIIEENVSRLTFGQLKHFKRNMERNDPKVWWSHHYLVTMQPCCAALSKNYCPIMMSISQTGQMPVKYP